MEEPRQRTTYPEIIDIKGLRTKWRVFIETFITLSFWGLIAYLLIFLVTFILWLCGFQLVYYEIYIVGFQEMERLFKNAGIITFVVVVIILFWSYYNVALIKIKGERRRSQVAISFDKDMAKFFKIDTNELEKIKNCPRLSISNKQDTIIFSETDLPASQNK